MSRREEMIPELAPQEPAPGEYGPVEEAVRKELDSKRASGLISDAFAGWEALAIRAARDVDQSAGIGAPSGRAKLLEVANSILENLPQPEVAQTSDLDRVLETILHQQ